MYPPKSSSAPSPLSATVTCLRQSARVGEGLVGVVGQLLDRRRQIQGRADIQFMMFGVVPSGDVADVCGFVKTASGKGDRKCLNTRAAQFTGVMKNGRRVDPAAEPNSQRHIGNQMVANGLAQQIIQL